jgi:cellulose synthase/poly-beta-1,6-N-acetylglucosamine synthase-like glycosyltransferase
MRKLKQIKYAPDYRPAIHILLPVLNEQVRLKEFVAYYLESLLPCYPNLKLQIITTEREIQEYPHSSTLSIVENIAEQSSTISHTHYPGTQGVMAHQLNFAIKTIPATDLIAIYNADSRPEIETFQWVLDRIEVGEQQIFQQYGIYIKNLKYLKSRFSARILIANAYWQCRWALGFEFYRAHSTINKHRWPNILKPFNYCIGHGLFVTSSLINELKFSEDTTNEDAVLGIQIANKNLSPIPIPYFDLSESPDSLKSIYIQKTNWFQGPYQAPIYYKKLKKRSNNTITLLVNCIKLFSHAVYWITGPLSLAVCFTLGIIASVLISPFFIVTIFAPLAFLVLPALATEVIMRHFRLSTDGFGLFKLLVSLIVGSIPAYIIHGMAGVRGFVLSKTILNGTKQKTVMSQYGEI